MLNKSERAFLLSSRMKKSSKEIKVLRFAFTYLYRREKTPTLSAFVAGCAPFAHKYTVMRCLEFLEAKELLEYLELKHKQVYLVTDKGYEALSEEIKKYTGSQEGDK